ncbi:MAG: ribosome biogenesis GTPase Der [Dehalococcoidia bacterium]
MNKPIVAIVGRPNVGKSTLFNRLVGRPTAIVEDLPGTTRDRVYGDMSWEGGELTLVDTGGLEPKPSTGIGRGVKEQIETAMSEADVIIFLVDGRQGLVPADWVIAERLRRLDRPLVLVVNKTESPKLREAAVEFYELGIGNPISISAHHGRGIYELVESVVALLPPSGEEEGGEEETEMLRLAIVGRPNVGKSLLLNSILGRKRALVSEIPGTTRDAIDTIYEYDGHRLLLIDTAGIRRRGRVEVGVEHYSVIRALRAIGRADVVVLVTEAEEVMPAQDLHIVGYAYEAFKGVVLVVNKWDLVEDGDEAGYREEVRRRLRFMPHVPVLFTSAKTGSGVGGIVPAVQQVYSERLKRPSTPELNNVIQKAVAAHHPPAIGGKKLNILHVVQPQVNPPTFIFFVNNPKLLHFSYRRYLENQLREAFGFQGTSLRLLFKARREG